MTFLFLDTETLGLDLVKHPIWEIAWAVNWEPIHSGLVPHLNVHVDEEAARVNNYHQRCTAPNPWRDISFSTEWELKGLLEFQQAKGDPVTVVGANPNFDLIRLEWRWGKTLWHYRAIDVESYAMPLLHHTKPKGLNRIADDLRARQFEIAYPDHTAAGDVACVRDVFTALQSLTQMRAGV